MRDPATGQPLVGVPVALDAPDPSLRPNEGPATGADRDVDGFVLPLRSGDGEAEVDVRAGEVALRVECRERD